MRYINIIFFLFAAFFANAQIVISDFNDGNKETWIESATKLSIVDSTLKVECVEIGGVGQYKLFFVNIPTLDMSKYTKIKIRINVPDTTTLAPIIRLELRDINGFDNNSSPVSKVPVRGVGFADYIFDFTNKFRQVSPTFDRLDPTSIVRLAFYINANNSNKYTGAFYLDDITLIGAQDPLIIKYGAEYAYATDTTEGWKTNEYNDESWTNIKFPASYNNSLYTSNVDSSASGSDNLTQVFFRKEFNISDISTLNTLLLKVNSDDATDIYINNILVQTHLPNGINERYYTLPSNILKVGKNIIAIHQKQITDSSKNLLLDIDLSSIRENNRLARGPYLQVNSETGIKVKWRTLTLETSSLSYGETMESLNKVIESSDEVLDHTIQISGLKPNTKYYYRIGSLDSTLTTIDTNHYFITHPRIGTEGDYTFWVIGDAGRSTNDQRNMAAKYLASRAGRPTNSWIILGDNAYDNGYDADYQRSMFGNMFESALVNTCIFPTPGNHDLDKFGNANKGITEAPYFDIFDMPTNGESGGVKSNVESYYSWDYGNVHFISLDSYGTSLATTDSMYTWLERDLKDNNQKWTVAYCHHPPHTKGTHDSDDLESNYGIFAKLRQNFMPLLESYGVDLVVTGHSHVYERSYLSHGFYKTSVDLPNEETILYPQSSGNGEAPYHKNVVHSLYPNKGTVYTVLGCSGLSSDKAIWQDEPSNYLSNDFFHYYNKDKIGSFVLNVNSDVLSGKFLTNSGVILDSFKIIKDSTSDMRTVYGVGAVIVGGQPQFAWADSTLKDSILVAWETDFLAETKLDYGLSLTTMNTYYNTDLKYIHTVKIPATEGSKIFYAIAYNEHKYILPKAPSRFYSAPALGTEDLIAASKLNVFPNPAKNKVHIQFEKVAGADLTIELVNIEGSVKKVLHNQANVSGGTFDKSYHLSEHKGIYIINVKMNNNLFSRKIIIE